MFMTTSIEIHSTLNYSLSELARIFNLSFTRYIVPVNLTPAALAEKIRCDSLDLEASRVAVIDQRLIGIALISRRGEAARLAGMGISPEYRNQGIGRRMLDQIIREESHRGTREIFLEVITQNTAALNLYRKAGFISFGRLAGFTSEPQPLSAEKPQTVSLREVGRAMIQWSPPDLPWQLAGETILQLGPKTRAFRLGNARAAVTPGKNLEQFIRCVVVPPGSRRQGEATKLLQSLFSQFPNSHWQVGSLVPENLSGLFRKIGFDFHPIEQELMAWRLDQSHRNSAPIEPERNQR